VGLVKFTPEPLVYLLFFTVSGAVVFKWLRKTDSKIYRTRPCPSVALHKPRNQRIIEHPHHGPHVLFIVVVDAGLHIEYEMCIFRLGKGISMKADPGRGRHFGGYLRIFQKNFIIICLRTFFIMTETRSISAFGMFCRTGRSEERRVGK